MAIAACEQAHKRASPVNKLLRMFMARAWKPIMAPGLLDFAKLAAVLRGLLLLLLIVSNAPEIVE
jgi:hypothetical protein